MVGRVPATAIKGDVRHIAIHGHSIERGKDEFSTSRDSFACSISVTSEATGATSLAQRDIKTRSQTSRAEEAMSRSEADNLMGRVKIRNPRGNISVGDAIIPGNGFVVVVVKRWGVTKNTATESSNRSMADVGMKVLSACGATLKWKSAMYVHNNH